MNLFRGFGINNNMPNHEPLQEMPTLRNMDKAAGHGLATAARGQSGLVFPSTLRDPDYADRPIIAFQCKYKKEGQPASIFLPCPGGISISDGASYNTINLGTYSAMAKAATAVKDAVKGAVKDGDAGGGVSGLLNKIMSGSSMSEAYRLGVSALPGGSLGALADYGAGAVTNPRTNTAFTGNAMRNFSFTFKLIATSAAESITARDIHSVFRQMVYAKETTSLSLAYPPLWTIKFMSGNQGEKKENPFIPKIHRCYLTSVSSTFNATSNTWRKDQAPLEIDIALSFQEMKILTQDDIVDLEGDEPKRSTTNAVRKALNELGGTANKGRVLGSKYMKSIEGLDGGFGDAVELIPGLQGQLDEAAGGW